MKTDRRNSLFGRLWPVVAVLGLIGGGYLLWHYTALPAQIPWLDSQGVATSAASAATTQEAGQLSTVDIQPADLVIGQISASGNIELAKPRLVVLETAGIVDAITVQAGDSVQAGDVLLTLDRTELERAVKRAELAFASAQNQLADVSQAPTASEIAVAEATLLEAQENLATVQAGPSDDEIAAARSSLAAAQAAYAELMAGPSEEELIQLSAAMKQAEIAVAEAQRVYDQIAWQASAGTSSEAAALQSATIDYESARAAYAEATATASASDIQSALSTIQSAKVQLEDLLNSPTEAEISAAKAQVVDAQAALDDLMAGPDATSVRDAEIALEQALVDLEEAYSALDAATVLAPIDGTVMAVDVEVGEQLSAGAVVMTLADLAQLELTINVAELDIPQVHIGQPAQVQIDALAGRLFDGTVAAIAPESDSSSTAVTFPVTIQLAGADLAGVRPGMSAVGTLADQSITADGSWLVPTNSIITGKEVTTIRVVRNGDIIPLQVDTGAVQGEWIVVQSPELQEGDQVIGSVASYVNQTQGEPRLGGAFGVMPPSGGQGPRQ